jgi:hypothetical protein
MSLTILVVNRIGERNCIVNGKTQLRRKAVASLAAAINDAGNGSTSSRGTEENWLKNAAAALGARSIYQRNRVFAETQKHDLLKLC